MPLLKNRFIYAFTFLLMSAGVTPGCSSEEAKFGSTIIGYNHTDNAIIEYRVKFGSKPSANGLSLLPHSGGGSFVCCIPIPTQWQEDMKLNVSIKELVQGQEKTREVVVPVPKYDGKYTNYLNIHFLRGGKVKVFILGTTMTSAGYPLKGAEADLGG